jgi:hypothetical protein
MIDTWICKENAGIANATHTRYGNRPMKATAWGGWVKRRRIRFDGSDYEE